MQRFLISELFLSGEPCKIPYILNNLCRHRSLLNLF